VGGCLQGRMGLAPDHSRDNIDHFLDLASYTLFFATVDERSYELRLGENRELQVPFQDLGLLRSHLTMMLRWPSPNSLVSRFRFQQAPS
jgi:hypothetical protein